MVWILIGMVTMLVFGVVLYGMVWIVMDMYHENCHLCGKQMNVMHKRETDYRRQIAIMEEREMECKKEIDSMRKREKVISNQVHLITTFRQGMYEAQRSMDQYVATIEKYCELKATHDSWFYSLTREQENYMYRLRHYLGLDEYINVKAATVIVRQYSEQTQKILHVLLEELEDALSKMNISEMKLLQEAMNDHEMHLSTLLETQMTHVKSNIISRSRELQVRGPFHQISSLFYEVLKETISIPLVAKFIKSIIL